jgi:hypothetical protein
MSTYVSPASIEVRDLELVGDDWQDEAVRAWLAAAKAAGIRADEFNAVENPIGRTTAAGWVVIDSRLWLVYVYDESTAVAVERPGPMCERVHHRNGLYTYLPRRSLERWRDVQQQAEEEGATVYGQDTLSGWWPYATSQRVEYPDGREPVYWLLEAFAPPLDEVIAEHQAREAEPRQS